MRSLRLRPKIALNYICWPLCINAGLESESDLGILNIILKGVMCKGV